jgi:drug/metabolite transporter (DMT)-like permease
MLLIILLNALFASTFTLGKMVLDYTKPLFFVGSSMLLAGLCLIIFQLIRAPKELIVARQDWRYFFEVSIFTIALSYGLQFWGMQSLPSFKACFLYNSGPFTSYIIAYFLFGERMRFKKWLGLLVGFLGLVPVLSSASPAEEAFSSLFYVSTPELAVLLSAACYAYGWFVIKVLVHERHYSPFTVNGISMVIGGIITLLVVPIIEGPVIIKEFFPFFALVTSTIIIEYMICNNLYSILLDKYSETFLSFSTFLIPLFGALYGFLFLSENITWHFLLSTCIVAIAIWLFYKAEMEENPTHHTRD